MDFTDYFDIPNEIIYLNTPGNGLLPKSHYQWRMQREKDFFDPKSNLRDQQPEFIAEVKKAIHHLFKCSTQNIYVTPNFSFGYNTLLNGLSENLKFAIVEDDYPSLNYPILSRTSNYITIKSDENIEENIRKCVRSENPDVLAISLVNYISGLKIDLDFVKELKRENPNLIIIGDATQYLGTEPFTFTNSGFDAIGTSGYKWMLAGFGNGFLLLSDTLKNLLYKKAQSGIRPKEKMWENKSIIDTFFEPGHQDTFSHGTLLQSLYFFEKMGLENIQKQIASTTEHAYQLLEDRGMILKTVKPRLIRSSLINVQVSPTLYPSLLSEGVKCFPRGTGVRIGIHLFNSKSDIDRFIAILDKII